MNPAWRDRFLTIQWNNRLSVGLGLPAAVFVGVALLGDVISDGAAFLGLALIGVFY